MLFTSGTNKPDTALVITLQALVTSYVKVDLSIQSIFKPKVIVNKSPGIPGY